MYEQYNRQNAMTNSKTFDFRAEIYNKSFKITC